MKIDHIAYRVKNKNETANFLCKHLGYVIATEFPIEFDDGLVTCLVLTKPMDPEIFISSSEDDTIVSRWVKSKGDGGVHHIAYKVENIEWEVEKMKADGVEFTSEIIDCPEDELRQIFTKPQLLLGGIIIELIERKKNGFCASSVKTLMEKSVIR